MKNSRYDFEEIQRKKPVGFIAPTYVLFEGKEEEMLVEELCKTSFELGLETIAFNFCGDHVHVLLKSDTPVLSKMMMHWKGKASYNFNRKVNPNINDNHTIKTDGTKQALWAKSYFQKIVRTDEELKITINYIRNNRKKHNLKPLSTNSIKLINNLLKKT